jgi:hypothetical protein
VTDAQLVDDGFFIRMPIYGNFGFSIHQLRQRAIGLAGDEGYFHGPLASPRSRIKSSSIRRRVSRKTHIDRGYVASGSRGGIVFSRYALHLIQETELDYSSRLVVTSCGDNEISGKAVVEDEGRLLRCASECCSYRMST